MKQRTAAIVLAVFWGLLILQADELPENEIQAAVNGYFDNFKVNILYPTLAFTKRLSGKTSFTGRYLVDCITAASMRSRFQIDGVTSATTRNSVDAVTSASSRQAEYPESAFDEVRNEFNAGIFHLIREGSLSLNVLYSTEHDYHSYTVAGQLSYPFAMKNTVLQAGFIRSWDRVFPDTRTWTRTKDVITVSGGLTQVLSPVWIAQLNVSVTKMSGFLSDPYQPVPVFDNGQVRLHETVLPDTRLRKAAGLRMNRMVSGNASLQLGYRYYEDDWDIRSHTANILLQRYISKKDVTLKLGFRHYFQNHARFFRDEYSDDTGFLTVDSKLNDLRSNEFEAGTEINGTNFGPGSLFHNEKVNYLLSVGFYQRRTPLPDWFSNYKNLYAYTFTFGLRYKL